MPPILEVYFPRSWGYFTIIEWLKLRHPGKDVFIFCPLTGWDARNKVIIYAP